MKSKQNSTSFQLVYEYTIVDKKLAKANENLKNTTIQQLRALAQKDDTLRTIK